MPSSPIALSVPLATCLRCGLTQKLTEPPRGYSARCASCAAVLARTRRFASISPARACALAALVLYPAAIALPVIELNKLGHVRPVTIWSGAVELISGGQLAVGLLVFICSIVIPILKIIGIISLDSERLWRSAQMRRSVHRAIDWIGRWSMLDVLLIALLVAAIKLGNWATLHAGIGISVFAALVVLSMLASAFFHPRTGVTQ